MLNGELNNIHNTIYFCNLEPENCREHIVLQIYGFYFQKFAPQKKIYPKKYFLKKNIPNALKTCLTMTRKKFKIQSRTFCCLYNDSMWPIWGKERSAPTTKNLDIWPKNMSTAHITMGWRSKATLARLNNFSKPINPQNPTVEEVLDDEGMHFEDEDFLEHVFFFQVCGRKNWLLLSSVIIHTAWFRKPKVSPGGIHHFSGSHLWFLS